MITRVAVTEQQCNLAVFQVGPCSSLQYQHAAASVCTAALSLVVAQRYIHLVSATFHSRAAQSQALSHNCNVAQHHAP
jgi:hypothetical protein